MSYPKYLRTQQILCDNVIDSEAERSPVESFFPQSYGTFEQRNISTTIDFFDMAHGTKNVSFDHIIDIRDGAARPGHYALWRVISQSVQKTQA